MMHRTQMRQTQMHRTEMHQREITCDMDEGRCG